MPALQSSRNERFNEVAMGYATIQYLSSNQQLVTECFPLNTISESTRVSLLIPENCTLPEHNSAIPSGSHLGKITYSMPAPYPPCRDSPPLLHANSHHWRQLHRIRRRYVLEFEWYFIFTSTIGVDDVCAKKSLRRVVVGARKEPSARRMTQEYLGRRANCHNSDFAH